LDKLLPIVTKECAELLKLLLEYDSEKRITAAQALRHDYFKELWQLEMAK
jgi:renal tumor antigen